VYSATLDDISGRVLELLGRHHHLSVAVIDAQAAYLSGTPPTPQEGGSVHYARIAPWMHDFDPAFPAPGTAEYRSMLVHITGNIPGVAEAGRTWFHHVQSKLTTVFGFTQCLVDRCVFYRVRHGSLMILGLYVDDAKVWYELLADLQEFYDMWKDLFGCSTPFEALSEHFTGLRFHPTALGTEITCIGVIRQLGPLLEAYPMPAGTLCVDPLPSNASLRLRDGPSDSNPLVEARVAEAMHMMGISGFAIYKVRMELTVDFVLLAPHVRPGHLTLRAWRYVLRLCHHLYLTAELPLVLAPDDDLFGGHGGATSYDVYMDSSHGNGELGRSSGGFCVMLGAGGTCASKSFCQRQIADSSGGQELFLATLALKDVLGINMLLSDLRQGGVPIPELKPVSFHLDATAVIDGVANEQIKRSSRWLSSRKAMLRAALQANVIIFSKVAAAENVADILTKTLVGAAFAKHRERLLGLHLLSRETIATFPPRMAIAIFGPRASS